MNAMVKVGSMKRIGAFNSGLLAYIAEFRIKSYIYGGIYLCT